VQATFLDYFRTHRIQVSRWLGAIGLLILCLGTSGWEGTPIEAVTFMCGVALAGIATVGRIWCSIYISGNKDAALITVGPYSIVRNPLYLFSGIGFVGLALAAETVVLPLIVVLLLVAFTPAVVAQEERFLAGRFGKEYADYVARTPRFIPRFAGYAQPATWLVDTRVLQRRLHGALWFVWGVAILEVIEDLHFLGVLPELYKLY